MFSSYSKIIPALFCLFLAYSLMAIDDDIFGVLSLNLALCLAIAGYILVFLFIKNYHLDGKASK